MTTTQKPPTTLSPHKAARLGRLEEQLRANLKRRKDAARARHTPVAVSSSPHHGPDDV